VSKWYFDIIYNSFIVYPLLGFGHIIQKIIDRGAIELLGPYGLYQSLRFASQNLTRLDSGVLSNYIILLFCGFLLFLFITFFLPYPKIILLILGLLLLLPLA
jgi:NADH-ubiquinone oxidoreductase chain 5